MNRDATAQCFMAVAIGIAHASIAGILWSKYVLIDPIDNWLVDVLLAKEFVVPFHIAAYATDLLVNVTLAAPFALILARLRPINSWKLLWIAVASSTTVSFSTLLVVDTQIFVVLTRTWAFHVSLIVFSISLPLAFVAVIYLMSWRKVA